MKDLRKTPNLSQLLIDIQKKDVTIIPINLSDIMVAWKKYRKVCKSEEKQILIN